jgi:hypothetical protein
MYLERSPSRRPGPQWRNASSGPEGGLGYDPLEVGAVV